MAKGLIEQILSEFPEDEQAAIRESFGNLLAGRFAALGVDVAEASRRCGMPVAILNEIIAGTCRLTYPMLKTLQQAFFPGSSPAELFRLSMPPRRSQAAEFMYHLIGSLDATSA